MKGFSYLHTPGARRLCRVYDVFLHDVEIGSVYRENGRWHHRGDEGGYTTRIAASQDLLADYELHEVCSRGPSAETLQSRICAAVDELAAIGRITDNAANRHKEMSLGSGIGMRHGFARLFEEELWRAKVDLGLD